MSDQKERFDYISEADIMRTAQALRARTIGDFVARLIGKTEKTEPVFPAHVAPAE